MRDGGQRRNLLYDRPGTQHRAHNSTNKLNKPFFRQALYSAPKGRSLHTTSDTMAEGTHPPCPSKCMFAESASYGPPPPSLPLSIPCGAGHVASHFLKYRPYNPKTASVPSFSATSSRSSHLFPSFLSIQTPPPSLRAMPLSNAINQDKLPCRASRTRIS